MPPEVTLLEIPPCQTPMCGVAYSCSYDKLCTLDAVDTDTDWILVVLAGRAGRILLRPRMRRIQAYLRKSSNHACLVTIESVCASPILFGEERLSPNIEKARRSVVIQLRQNHKKTSWSDEKLTITPPATTFHASSTLPSCRSALRGKDAKLAKLHTKSA